MRLNKEGLAFWTLPAVLRALVQLLQEPNRKYISSLHARARAFADPLLMLSAADDALVASIAEVYNQDRAAFNKTVSSEEYPLAVTSPESEWMLTSATTVTTGSGVGQEGTPEWSSRVSKVFAHVSH